MRTSLLTHPGLPSILGLDLTPEPPGIRVVRLQPWPEPVPIPQEERQFQSRADFQVYWRSLALSPARHPGLIVSAAAEAHDPEGLLPWLEGQGAILVRYPNPDPSGSRMRRVLDRFPLPRFAWTAYLLALQAAYLHRAPKLLAAVSGQLRRVGSLLDGLDDSLADLAEALVTDPAGVPSLPEPSEREVTA